MKSLILSLLLTLSLQALAAENCDLRKNDAQVDELNAAFDRFEMRGEDHAIGLKLLYDARLELIKECLRNGRVAGITVQEMNDVLPVSEQDDQN